MNRIAVFGGVYNNHLALREVIADIARRGVDQAWCLGDVGGFGPHPPAARAALTKAIRGKRRACMNSR